jgi:hypothetical protein
MKKVLLIAILALVPALVYGQIYINQDFSGDFPPTGWSADSHASNWGQAVSNNAGGSSPELGFSWSPQFSGTTRFMSPQINLTGVTSLKVQFRHFVDHFQSPYTIGVATRHGTGAWNVVWSMSPTANVGPVIVSRTINNADVGTSNFQICWYFTGSSYNIDYWYVDDVILYQPFPHDFMVGEVLVNPEYQQFDVITPSASIVNFGANTDTATVKCEIFRSNGTSLYTDSATSVILTAGQTLPVNFTPFTVSLANELYKMRVTTLLSNDMNTSNDTSIAWFDSYTTPRNMVITEIGTGTWCQYCPGAAIGAEDMIDAGFNTGIVEYHAYNSDPFEIPSSLARVVYYGISGFPTAVFDGLIQVIGGDTAASMFNYYMPIYQARANINSAFSLGIYGTHTGNTYQLQVQVTKNAPIAYQNLVLQVALTESNISFPWQNQTQLNFVDRLMVPDDGGTPIDFSTGDIQVKNLNFVMDGSWVANNCELVAFLQNGSDVQNLPIKDIVQGAKVSLPALTSLGVSDDQVALPTQTRLVGNYPNPFNPSTTIEFSLATAGNVRLDVFNLLGQRVTTLVNSNMAAGNHSVIWDGRDASGASAASGAYFYKLSTNTYSSTRKMLLTK